MAQVAANERVCAKNRILFTLGLSYVHRVSKKLCQCYFANNSVEHWPNLIIFGMQHREERGHNVTGAIAPTNF